MICIICQQEKESAQDINHADGRVVFICRDCYEAIRNQVLSRIRHPHIARLEDLLNRLTQTEQEGGEKCE